MLAVGTLAQCNVQDSNPHGFKVGNGERENRKSDLIRRVAILLEKFYGSNFAKSSTLCNHIATK